MAFAEQQDDAAVPAHLAEHAGGAQHPPGLEREPREPGLDHGDHGLRQRRVLALGDGADQLLEVERVAVGLLDQALHGVAADGVAQHLAHQPLAGLAAELLEPELLDVLALRPQLGEDLEHLGARQREYHPRLLAPIPQGGVDELHGAEVAPVQVFGTSRTGVRGGLGLEEVQPSSAHQLAHQLGVPARGPQRVAGVAGVVGHRRADELAEERGHPVAVTGRRAPGDPCPEPVAAVGQRIAVVEAERAAQRLGQQSSVEPARSEIAAADPDRGPRGGALGRG